jgi:hypothetical protein
MTPMALALAPRTPVGTPDHAAAIAAAARRAADRIAPLWPLSHFVAVNPFVGLSDLAFGEAAAYLARVAKQRMTMPRAEARALLAAGAFEARHLAAVLPEASGMDAAAVIAALDAEPAEPKGAVVATVADVLHALAGGDAIAARTAFMIDEISRFCASYFDEGQAAWRNPWRAERPYAAWRAAASHDRNPELMGVAGFRRSIAALPADPLEAIAEIVAALGIPVDRAEAYMFRALFDVRGWAGYARYKVWRSALDGREDNTLLDLLAIRLAWGYGLFRSRTDEAFRAAWAAAVEAAQAAPAEVGPDLLVDLAVQDALDLADAERLAARLGARAAPAATPRPSAQVAFCIDVRSEPYRRALESVGDGIETIGFAGFFGFAIEYVPLGNRTGGAQCPIFFKPGAIVCEAIAGANEDEELEVLGLRRMRRRAAKAFRGFRHSAVSSFAYVETLGLAFAPKLVADALGATRPTPDPTRDGLDAPIVERLGPTLAPRERGGRLTGIPLPERIRLAETALTAMSLREGFGRILLLVGHGSTSVNNPHASGLDCGACGGHTGEANARVAAAILADPEVRAGLAERGLAIPDDTIVLAGLHDTTTDALTVFDLDAVPQSHRADLEALLAATERASVLTRHERGRKLALAPGENAETAVPARARDWSQVRPEWGLAGCAAFIAAPRWRTQGLDLGGRSFLHSYDWRRDDGFGVLELIMTAPLVVASWINLQYFGSTVNNDAFGSGNKVLHNVVGALGVLEGNGGDLRPGLPLQSLHDGTRPMHDPLRLKVAIDAPTAAMDAVILKHETVRRLVENGWLFLYAFAPEGGLLRRAGAGEWLPFTAGGRALS